MFEIGSSLRQARQHRGLVLADVERATHIRVKYLAALEDDRFDVCPGPAYVRGFLRTYADFLGLDGGLLVDEYNEHFAPAEEELQPIQPQGLRRAGNQAARPLALAAVALVAGTLAVWQLGFGPPEQGSDTTARLGIEPAAAAATPKPAAKPKQVVTAKPAARPKPRTLVIRTTRGPCWVAVRVGSQRGRLVYRGIVPRGRTLRFGLGARLWVRLGAPRNADVTVRGKRVGGLPNAPVNLTAA